MNKLKIDMEKTIKYWKESSEYDIKTAQSLYKSKRYPYTLFFGHLAIEKLLKAMVVKETKTHAPHTHSLPLLISKLSTEIPEEMKSDLAGFMEFYFESRYPEEQKIFYKKCTKKFTEKNLKKIDEVYRWLKKKLEKE